MFARTACPLCGHRHHARQVDGFLVCDGCCEMLRPAELVRLGTPWTAHRYRRENQ